MFWDKNKKKCIHMYTTVLLYIKVMYKGVYTTEWILGFCQDGPTPPSHPQKGAKVESRRGPYGSAFSQEDLHEWSPLVINQQQL